MNENNKEEFINKLEEILEIKEVKNEEGKLYHIRVNTKSPVELHCISMWAEEYLTGFKCKFILTPIHIDIEEVMSNGSNVDA